MGAVGEAALTRQVLYLSKGVGDRSVGFPQPERAQARGVDEHCPAGEGDGSRAVVVWRPFPSPRSDPVASSSVPSPRALARVDLPAPEGPSNATVDPGVRSATKFVQTGSAGVRLTA